MGFEFYSVIYVAYYLFCIWWTDVFYEVVVLDLHNPPVSAGTALL